MKLYILRHGEAAEHGDPRYKENERPLTTKGIQRTKQLAHVLREMDISFDSILSSPLTRARETAEIVARGLKLQDNMRFSEHLTPSGSMEELVHQINMLRPAQKSVALVGHEPYLSGFISLLCTGGPGLPMVFKKGALCRLDIEVLSCGKCAQLDWLLQPRVIGFSPGKRKEEK
ncbi:MAG TPA: phosphohistidine phosphatase SixA [Candidatus Polarisedimenticolia bacterium]|nr:phosphohistidine phosphatase SixA [Candidatus Polarisedimenticolia bacterium]